MKEKDTAKIAAALSTLSRRLAGTLISRDHADYDEARALWNARLSRSPLAIARCTSPEDVATCVRVAREHDLELGVRSGGHDYAGHSTCEGGLLVDLSLMKDVRVDLDARRVHVDGGTRWADVDAEALPHGLAVCGGTVSTVGVAGFTLGGGYGHLTRKHGLVVDNLVSAELVTSSGEQVRASASENADLYWALRGGRGNFGIVTRFEFQAHPLGASVLSGQIIYPFADIERVLAAYRDFAFSAPDELTCYAFIIRVPPIPEIPEEYHGQVAIDLVVVYFGETSEGEKVIAPLRSLGSPILDFVAEQPYAEVQKTFDPGVPAGLRWYTRANEFDTLSDSALETMARHTRDMPGATTMVYLSPGGGAMARVAPDATAYRHRSAQYSLHILCGWSDPADDEANMRWVRAFHDEMTPHATGGVYVNLLGEDENARIPEAYGANYDRLRKIKATWDPENRLRKTQNIPPAGPADAGF